MMVNIFLTTAAVLARYNLTVILIGISYVAHWLDMFAFVCISLASLLNIFPGLVKYLEQVYTIPVIKVTLSKLKLRALVQTVEGHPLA